MLILSFTDALSSVRDRPEWYDVISLGPDAPARRQCRRHVQLDFDDLSSAPDPASHREGRAPETKHVCQALSFARQSTDDRLLIHCRAGLSRSPAMAWCILLDRLKQPEAATEALFRLHPQAIPNPVVVHCGLELLTGTTHDFAAVRRHMRTISQHPRKLLFL